METAIRALHGAPEPKAGPIADARRPVHVRHARSDTDTAGTAARSSLLTGGGEGGDGTGMILRARAYGLFAGLALLSSPIPALAGCGDSPAAKIDWTGCQKRNLMLGGNAFDDATLARTVLTSSDLRKSSFKGAKLAGADLTFARLDEADLSGADLTKTIGWQTNLTKANLSKAKLAGAQMSRANFTGAKLDEASLSKAELNRSDFTGADLTGVDATKAELARVNFTKAKLDGVDFGYANLARARLEGLDLAGVKFGGAYMLLTQIGRSDLSKAQGLKQEQIDLACGTRETKLPPGLTAPKSWPCPSDED